MPFETEWMNFPVNGHDDFVDSLRYSTASVVGTSGTASTASTAVYVRDTWSAPQGHWYRHLQRVEVYRVCIHVQPHDDTYHLWSRICYELSRELRYYAGYEMGPPTATFEEFVRRTKRGEFMPPYVHPLNTRDRLEVTLIDAFGHVPRLRVTRGYDKCGPGIQLELFGDEHDVQTPVGDRRTTGQTTLSPVGQSQTRWRAGDYPWWNSL